MSGGSSSLPAAQRQYTIAVRHGATQLLETLLAEGASVAVVTCNSIGPSVVDAIADRERHRVLHRHGGTQDGAPPPPSDFSAWGRVRVIVERTRKLGAKSARAKLAGVRGADPRRLCILEVSDGGERASIHTLHTYTHTQLYTHAGTFFALMRAPARAPLLRLSSTRTAPQDNPHLWDEFDQARIVQVV